MVRITFTKHATEKFSIVRTYGFEISRETVVKAISLPDKIERRGIQTFSTIILDKEFALRVVHEERKGIIVVITFYPIKRERYGI